MDFLEKFEKLPKDIQDFFFSSEVNFELKKACFVYAIAPEKIRDISGEIGLIPVGDFPLESLPKLISEKFKTPSGQSYGIAYEINKRLFSKFPTFFTKAQPLLSQWEKLKTPPVISEEQATEKYYQDEPWMLKKNEEEAPEEEEEEVVFETMSPEEALEKYPQIGEQAITSQKIMLKGFAEGVRPSLKNWLTDYYSALGNGEHDSIQRNQFLFHSHNAALLSFADRERLADVFKSFDEGSNLTINPQTKTMLFPEPRLREQARPTATPQTLPTSKSKNDLPEDFFSRDSFTTKKIVSAPTSPVPESNIRRADFSSPQKMSFERQTPPQAQIPPQPSQPRATFQPSAPQKPLTFSPKPFVPVAPHQKDEQTLKESLEKRIQQNPELSSEAGNFKLQTAPKPSEPQKLHINPEVPQKNSLSNLLSSSKNHSPAFPETTAQPVTKQTINFPLSAKENSPSAEIHIPQTPTKNPLSLGDQLRSAKNVVNLRDTEN